MGKTGYAFGAAVFPALYVGANHRLERICFVADSHGESAAQVLRPPGRSDGFDFWHGFWEDRVCVKDKKGKRRGCEPKTSPVADGLPGSLALLRAAGNAIVPQQAAEFVTAFFEAKGQARPKAMSASAGR